jgi:hypothetical protein
MRRDMTDRLGGELPDLDELAVVVGAELDEEQRQPLPMGVFDIPVPISALDRAADQLGNDLSSHDGVA